jgi:predicted ArsR family transcriptional regulator
MVSELTSEQEKQVQERMKEQEQQIQKQANERECSLMAWFLKTYKEYFGEEAYRVYVNAYGEGVRSHWSRIAEEAGDNSIEALIKRLWEPLPTQGFEYTVEETGSGFQINCTKCPHIEMAKRLGIMEEMFYTICEADSFIAEGFNPNIGFKRTKTLMQGDDCCDHFYYYKDKS